jgi:hypothetical protein
MTTTTTLQRERRDNNNDDDDGDDGAAAEEAAQQRERPPRRPQTPSRTAPDDATLSLLVIEQLCSSFPLGRHDDYLAVCISLLPSRQGSPSNQA